MEQILSGVPAACLLVDLRSRQNDNKINHHVGLGKRESGWNGRALRRARASCLAGKNKDKGEGKTQCHNLGPGRDEVMIRGGSLQRTCVDGS